MTVRELVVSEFLSLDGVMEDPQWTFRYWNDEIAAFKHDELFNAGALLLGRVTYEGFADAWPGRAGQNDYADRMNAIPKHVVSTTLDEAGWNNSTLIKENVADEIANLKEQAGQDLLLFGSGDLTQTLIDHDLVDRYQLLIYPLVLGGGQRLFTGDYNLSLDLVDTKAFSSGVVLVTYRPAPDDG